MQTRSWKIGSEYQGVFYHDHAVVVERNGDEIDFFPDEKAAGSWIQHVYGLRPYDARGQGITIKTIRDRGPRAGDAVTYKAGGELGSYSYLLESQPGPYGRPGRDSIFGILDHSYGRDSFGICFGPSAFREHSMVSCSGGPIPNIVASSLTFVGLRPTLFWRWGRGYSGGGEGGNYTINVPHWEWDGTCKPLED